MQTLATLFGGIVTALRAGLARLAGGEDARAALLRLAQLRLGRMVLRFDRLFARYQAGTLPSQTGASPRPSRAGQSRTDPPQGDQRPRLPAARMWIFAHAQPPSAIAAGYLRNWMAHPELGPFLAAAPQAGRILRPLCRMLGIDAEPGVPPSLNLRPPPKFRPAPPSPPPHRGIIEPPEGPPPDRRAYLDRAGLAFCR